MANISKIKLKNNYKIAKIGEQIAQLFLLRKKYVILLKNVRYRGGEIDIIAKKRKLVVFVEVKTRTNWQFGYPEVALDERKKQRLEIAINHYIYKNNYLGEWQVDLIAIDLMNKKAKLRHYQAIEL